MSDVSNIAKALYRTMAEGSKESEEDFSSAFEGHFNDVVAEASQPTPTPTPAPEPSPAPTDAPTA